MYCNRQKESIAKNRFLSGLAERMFYLPVLVWRSACIAMAL